MFVKFKNEYFVFFVGLLIYLPLILWGGYFLDDNYRSVYGYYAWTGDYRPVADWIYDILGFGTEFIDTFPLNYIIQYFLVSYFIICFTQKIQEKFLLNKELKNYISISVSFLFLSPFFMQNLYFRYDSLIMVVSVILACLPFFFNNKKIDLVCCILVLFTYQSSIFGYMCVWVLRILILNMNSKSRFNIYKEIFKSIGVLVLAFIIFFLVTKILITPNNYAKNHMLLVTSFDMLIENIKFSLGVLDFSSSLLDYALFFSSFMLCTALIFSFIFKNLKTNKADKILIFFGILIIFLIGFLNVNIILLKPRLYPRTYVSIGFIIFLIGLSLTILISLKDIVVRKYVYFYKFLLLSIFLICINIFYVSLNYIKENERYENNLNNNINYDLSTLNLKSFNFVMVYGDIQYTRRSLVLEKRFPIIRKTLDSKFNFKRHRMYYTLLENEGFKFNSTGFQSLQGVTSYNLHINDKPTFERKEYNIIVTKENDLFIFFKKNGVLARASMVNRLD